MIIPLLPHWARAHAHAEGQYTRFDLLIIDLIWRVIKYTGEGDKERHVTKPTTMVGIQPRNARMTSSLFLNYPLRSDPSGVC